MRIIAILGAGRSASSLIQYLIAKAPTEQLHLRIADKNIGSLTDIVNGASCVEEVELDVTNEESRKEFIQSADIVISMLPARFHILVAKDCVALKKNMVTASYINEEMQALHEEAVQNNVMLLNEMGVDPGIDYMSPMKIIDELKHKGSNIIQFESFTGGLVAPESDNNPWGYKFTWNPRNVVIAGQGGAVKFVQEGRTKFIPYHNVFRRTEVIDIPEYGQFEGYANRDSLSYINTYNLHGIPTMFRGTLRRPGFCRAWDVFVKLGATDDSYVLEDSEGLTHRQFINKFLAYNPHDSVELKLMHNLKIDQDSDVMRKLTWLGIFSDEVIPLKNATPAQVLQHILMKKWQLDPNDKDMIVMVHLIGYELNGEQKLIKSSMVSLGDDQTYTAMAKTVGLPVAISALKILNQEIFEAGVHLPVQPHIYEPVLAELEAFGIAFTESEQPYESYAESIY
jgi:saccharopine dehydrogenase-like NADP-dependent oxidoreductase